MSIPQQTHQVWFPATRTSEVPFVVSCTTRPMIGLFSLNRIAPKMAHDTKHTRAERVGKIEEKGMVKGFCEIARLARVRPSGLVNRCGDVVTYEGIR